MTADLSAEYGKKKREIRERLKDFKAVWDEPDRRLFSELCFCICTPQSKAIQCDKAISGLEKSGVLFKGRLREINTGLKAIRFHNNKARYIVGARKLFTKSGAIRIKDRIEPRDVQGTRLWLVRNVKGLGFKEASHFLRNIGLGKGLAILDVHILKNMVRYGVIKEAPGSLSRKGYLALEDKLRKFSKKINIPMDELDLLFWSSETGEVFK